MKIQLDKKREIRLDFNALAEYEDLTGRKGFDMDNLGVKEYRALAYAGCKSADKDFDLTIEEVGDFMYKEGLDVIGQVTEAIINDFPKVKGDKKKE